MAKEPRVVEVKLMVPAGQESILVTLTKKRKKARTLALGKGETLEFSGGGGRRCVYQVSRIGACRQDGFKLVTLLLTGDVRAVPTVSISTVKIKKEKKA